MAKKPATTCTNHCSQCGRHFHSLEAFDIHHDHDETGWPVCLAPVDLLDRDDRMRLVALTEHGECRRSTATTPSAISRSGHQRTPSSR